MIARAIAALAAGVLFGMGLAVSGMMNPAKVLNFLDLAGNWDPSLALVMGAALIVSVPAYRFAARRERPVLADRFDLPVKRELDAPLLGGGALFGLGWGLVGLCPGPALALLVTGLPKALIFFAALMVGALAHRVLTARR